MQKTDVVEKSGVVSLEGYDSIQLTMPDIHTVPRGKVVAADMEMVMEGIDMWKGITMLSPKGGVAFSVPYLNDSRPSHLLRPCLETLTPWPWVSTDQRRVGNVLCDMYLTDGSPDPLCPRQQLKQQLDSMWTRHGLSVSTAFEYEFFAFKQNTLEPFGGTNIQFCDLRVWGEHQELFSQLRETLASMGVRVRMIQPEFPPGQWELTTQPYCGVTGADIGFYVKNAVKGFFKKRGYDATFMTRPILGSAGSGLHLNHSLWKVCSVDGMEENVFVGSDGGLSETAQHWMAGLLTHAEALTAVLCPSLNCYRRLYGPAAPSFVTWGLDDRKAMVRARVLKNNVFLENRGVSAAASPYLALAATVAAGLDGLERRLKCPPPMKTSSAKELPRTLAQALTALEKDKELTAMLGQDFVDCYVNSKRENEVLAFEKANLKCEEEQIAFERDMYFQVY